MKNNLMFWIEMKSKLDKELVNGYYFREFTGLDGD